MFFHTSEEESGICRFAVTFALSPIVGFAATSPEGGSDACRFATTSVSTEEFTPEKGSNVRRRGEVSLKATEGDDKLSFT